MNGLSAGLSPVPPNPYVNPVTVSAPRTNIDPATGNVFTTQRDMLGNTVVRGTNTYTGRQWQNVITPNGHMSGTNSRGQRWQYNANTQMYQNLNTGRTCWQGRCW